MVKLVLVSTLLLAGCPKSECKLDADWEARKQLIPPGASACEIQSSSLIFHLDGENPKPSIVSLFLAAGYERDLASDGNEMSNFRGPAGGITALWNREKNGSWRVVYNPVRK